MLKHTLSKTDYIQFLNCPEELWISKNRKELLPPFPIDAQHKVEQGKLVDKLAKEWLTQEPIIADQKIKLPSVVFQKRATKDAFVAIADIVIFHTEKECTLLEVKASTHIKDEHYHDIAFQQMVFEAAGYQVRNTFIVHLNKEFRTKDRLDLNEFFVAEEVTTEVQDLLTETEKNANLALGFIHKSELPKGINLKCSNKKKCLYLQHYSQPLPTYSIFDIRRIHISKLEALVAQGIYSVQDIPSDFDLSEKQRIQVDIAQQNKAIIEKEKIAEVLESLRYPLYFLDYETFSYVVPPQKGFQPYDQMVFQYSLHVIEEPNAPLKHYEYLLKTKTESVEYLLADLQKNIHPTEGTVIVWNEKFEKPRNEEMAALFPQYKSFLTSVNDRVYDLMEIFWDGLYQHPTFKGSASIKKVLPVLCPELTYQDLDIQNGMAAVIKWHHMTDSRLLPEEAEKTFQDLLKYCHLDTLAMVRIWEELSKI